MSQKILSGTIATEEFNLIKGYLVIENNVITEIKEKKPPKEPDINGLILPSLINAHTHLGDAALNVDPKKHSLAELVGPGGKKEKGLQKLSDQKKIEGIKSAAIEANKKGVTHISDFREEGLKGVKLLKKSLKDIDVKLSIYGRPQKINKKEIDELIPSTDGIGISSVNDYSKNELNLLKKYLAKKDIEVALHAAETIEGQKKSIEDTNKTEVERALKFNPSYLVHVTHPKREDLDLIKEKNTPIVICPRSNKITGVGKPPLSDLLEKNIKVGLGTDNAMINSPSILEEIKFIFENYFPKKERNQEVLKKLFQIATTKNGEILGINNKIIENTPPSLVVFEEKNKPLKSLIYGKNKIKEIIN